MRHAIPVSEIMFGVSEYGYRPTLAEAKILVAEINRLYQEVALYQGGYSVTLSGTGFTWACPAGIWARPR